MKRLLSVLLCLVTCLCCSLTAFAGGPRPAEDVAAAGHTDNIAAAASLPSGLSIGKTYTIKSMDSGSTSYMLNVDGGIDSNGNPVNMWEYDGSPEQRFKLISSGSGYKLVALCSSNKVLDAYRNSDGSLKDGCNADIWDDNDDEAQELTISGDNTSGYVIRLAHQGLTLTAVSLSNGVAVQFKNYTGKDNQRWKFTQPNDTLQRNPNPNCQNKELWCWAASAKMVANHNSGGLNPEIDTAPQMLRHTDGLHKSYYGEGTINGTKRYFADGVQYAIVKQAHGNDENDIGTIDDMKKALKYAHPNNATYKSAGSAGYALSESNKTLFKSEVQKGRCMMVGFGKINAEGKYVGHVVVITDYDPATKKYTLYDPWKGTPATIIGDNIFSYSNTLAGSNDYRLEYFFFLA